MSRVELTCGCCLTGAINMKSKEISMQEKEAKTPIWYILKKKESTGELNN